MGFGGNVQPDIITSNSDVITRSFIPADSSGRHACELYVEQLPYQCMKLHILLHDGAVEPAPLSFIKKTVCPSSAIEPISIFAFSRILVNFDALDSRFVNTIFTR